LIIILVVTLINLIFGPRLQHKPFDITNYPLVSILIPARNEEHNIARCITSMLNQDYPNFEIIVLNDNSTDRTGEIIESYSREDNKVKYIHGKKLPGGWTGKNWACHQLSQNASGDILIFTDSDNTHEEFAITNTISYFQKYNLGMFSAFPQQKTVSLGEKLIVPIIDLFVYSTLPLWATYFFNNPSLAAANGQWITFTRDAYDLIGGHLAIKNILVEDTTLNRLAKTLKIKTLTAIGTNAVYCRMYANWNEVWGGFSRHYYGLAGNNDIAYFMITLVSLSIFVSPYITIFNEHLFIPSLIAISLNSLIRLIGAIRYKHSILTSVIFHPLSILITNIIGFNSFLKFKSGLIQWKDRLISIKKA